MTQDRQQNVERNALKLRRHFHRTITKQLLFRDGHPLRTVKNKPSLLGALYVGIDVNQGKSVLWLFL